MLLLALVHSCQLRCPPPPPACRGRGVYHEANMNCYTDGKCTTCSPWPSITVCMITLPHYVQQCFKIFFVRCTSQPGHMDSNTPSSTPLFTSAVCLSFRITHHLHLFTLRWLFQLLQLLKLDYFNHLFIHLSLVFQLFIHNLKLTVLTVYPLGSCKLTVFNCYATFSYFSHLSIKLKAQYVRITNC